MAEDIRIELDQAPPGWRPANGGGTPTEFLGLRLLPGEEVLRASRRTVYTPLPEVRDGLFLTNLRIIYAGRIKQWAIFPRGTVIRSAFIEDVDVGGLGTRRLNALWLIAGLLLFVTGAAGLSVGDGAADNFGALWLIGGLIVAALWLFVRREGIAFAVAGDEAFEHGYFQLSAQDRAAMADFLNAFFELKHGAPSGHTPLAAGRGFEV
jgi:hypothetical protein